jgi:hypothetical protein
MTNWYRLTFEINGDDWQKLCQAKQTPMLHLDMMGVTPRAYTLEPIGEEENEGDTDSGSSSGRDSGGGVLRDE